MIKSNNYINIQGWMVTDLQLKGNDLLIYAIIYGFSQTENTYFSGSLQYLCDWTNSTRQGVLKNLDNLIELGYIIKEDSTPTNKYFVNKDIVNSVTQGVNLVTKDVNLVTPDCKLSLHNNINNNILNNNKYNVQKELNEKIEDIISYLNSICNTNFKSTTNITKKLIKQHINEGFTIEDFKRVIDCKYQDWGEKPFRFSNGQLSNEYLRPSTLFGPKFETYVYEATTRETSEGYFNSISSEVDEDVSNLVF